MAQGTLVSARGGIATNSRQNTARGAGGGAGNLTGRSGGYSARARSVADGGRRKNSNVRRK